MLVSPNHVLFLLAVLAGVAGCSTSSQTAADSSQTPMALCKGGLRHKTITSASATTVGSVRALAGGPAGARIEAKVFKGAKASAPVAWCWVSRGTDSWTAYAVGPSHVSIRVAEYTGVSKAPTGEPALK